MNYESKKLEYTDQRIPDDKVSKQKQQEENITKKSRKIAMKEKVEEVDKNLTK